MLTCATATCLSLGTAWTPSRGSLVYVWAAPHVSCKSLWPSCPDGRGSGGYILGPPGSQPSWKLLHPTHSGGHWFPNQPRPQQGLSSGGKHHRTSSSRLLFSALNSKCNSLENLPQSQETGLCWTGLLFRVSVNVPMCLPNRDKEATVFCFFLNF